MPAKWAEESAKPAERADRYAQAGKLCSAAKKCGGCQYLAIPYEDQLKEKHKMLKRLLGEYGFVQPVLGMKNPKYYRNKTHHVMGRDRFGNPISGTYEENSHRLVEVKECLLEDIKSQEIIRTIQSLLKSFKVTVYDEDRDFGLLRHVMIRRGFASGEYMVVLVVTSPIFPSKNNFFKALRKVHPEITTVVLNLNDKATGMVLGERNITLYGPGFIKDKLCDLTFRISPTSFYQVNPVQTEVLYRTAIDFAQLTDSDVVLDAYCGIGTIGLSAAGLCRKVIGVELNRKAVADAGVNAKANGIANAYFYQGDAGDFMTDMASKGEKADVVFMDPPRSGSTEKFMDAVVKLNPNRVVYVSCGPDTLARDLKYMTQRGYRVKCIQPVDMFPYTAHVETVCLLAKQ